MLVSLHSTNNTWLYHRRDYFMASPVCSFGTKIIYVNGCLQRCYWRCDNVTSRVMLCCHLCLFTLQQFQTFLKLDSQRNMSHHIKSVEWKKEVLLWKKKKPPYATCFLVSNKNRGANLPAWCSQEALVFHAHDYQPLDLYFLRKVYIPLQMLMF